jgi:hypothetical protein
MSQPDQRFDAFALMQRGEPLAFQIARGRRNGHPVSLVCFAIDARLHEWEREDIEHAIKVALEMNLIRFRDRWLRNSLAQLWTKSGGLRPPQCWVEMKKRFIDDRLKADQIIAEKTEGN